MKPLRVEEPLRKLLSPYPDPATFRETVRSLSFRLHESLVRLWLTEGIPFAFRDCPALYEEVRGWLASRLRVCPKEITLLGSARLGFSLASPPNYGRAFNSESDLDVSVVSEWLFQEISKAFEQWKADYAAHIVEPKHPKEREFWENNLRFADKNLPKGFLDANKIPNRNRYPIAQALNQAMWQLKHKLQAAPDGPEVRRASVRVYKSWRELVARVSYNLQTAVRDT